MWFVIVLSVIFGCSKNTISMDLNKELTNTIFQNKKIKFIPYAGNKLLPFRNKSLPIKERIDDLVSHLSLDEVVLQLSRGGANLNGPAPPIERLGIAPYNWNNEGIHGYMSPRFSTGFPSPIGLAATFNKTAITEMAKAVAVEARASHNTFAKEGIYDDHTCLSLFAPVINIMRHPLWGRNQETYGEDPVLTSYLARSYISGLQELRGGYPGATSVCKHFGVHNGPENIPSSRFSFNAVVDEPNFGQTYMVAFRQCVLAHTYGVMCSYNAINGVPACANKYMITDVLRGKFAFDGYVVSDEGAIEHIDNYFNYTKSPLDTAVASHGAGVDLELTYYGRNNRFSLLKEAVQMGRVDEEALRASAKRLFYVRMVLGEFDPPEDNPWNDVNTSEILSEPHRRLAAEIAEQSYVLLKNDGLLPLKPIIGKIAVHRVQTSELGVEVVQIIADIIRRKTRNNLDAFATPPLRGLSVLFLGPFANNTQAVTGDYPTNPNNTFTTPVDSWHGLSSLPPNVASGCVGDWDKSLPECTSYNESSVKTSIAPDVGLIVVTVGTGTNIEAEGHDRSTTSLPANQYRLIDDAATYGAGNIPVVVVIYSAAPVLIDKFYRMKEINAIVMCHFPAQSAGTLAPVMLGERVPAARLPYSWYNSDYKIPSITNYNIRQAGLTYRYTDPKNVLFPFGYGLSYTEFSYENLQVQPNNPGKCEDVKVQVEVSNTGDYDADEVVQIYVRLVDSKQSELIKLQLVAFDRVYVPNRSSVTIELVIEQFAAAIWQKSSSSTEDFDYYVVPGTYSVFVGGQQPGQMLKLSSNIVESSFTRTTRYLLSDCHV